MMYTLLSGVDMIINLIRQREGSLFLIMLCTGSGVYGLHAARCYHTCDDSYDESYDNDHSPAYLHNYPSLSHEHRNNGNYRSGRYEPLKEHTYKSALIYRQISDHLACQICNL